jgi:hypothetical protein
VDNLVGPEVAVDIPVGPEEGGYTMVGPEVVADILEGS